MGVLEHKQRAVAQRYPDWTDMENSFEECKSQWAGDVPDKGLEAHAGDGGDERAGQQLVVSLNVANRSEAPSRREDQPLHSDGRNGESLAVQSANESRAGDYPQCDKQAAGIVRGDSPLPAG